MNKTPLQIAVDEAVREQLKTLRLNITEDSFTCDPEDSSRCFKATISINEEEISECHFDIS